MKIFVDENIPLMTVRTLREMDHDVTDIRGTTEEGSTDEALWQMVQKQERLLINASPPPPVNGYRTFFNACHA
ncbi:MAG: DUF5615 family PIN-like protein [Deltaproteobacteria bacterium]|nr:DUF5615 family PIN-like protein [Deltaproteobacteria bacterium]